MIALVVTVHVLVCIFLILVILLQAGKGGGMGAAFGGAGSQTLFGGRGAQTFLGKVTSIAAAIFMLTSLALSYQSSKSSSVVRREAQEAPAQAPQQGAGAPLEPPPNPSQSTPPMGGAPNAPTQESPPAGGPNQPAK